MRYIELHSRSAFSFLRGSSSPEQLAEAAARLDLPALAICDRDGVYGAPRLSAAADEQGIRAIIGAELTMEDGSILPLLVKSRQGYQNLCQCITRAKMRAPKGEGMVRWNELPEFAEGLVALTGDAEGPLLRALKQECASPGGAGLSRATRTPLSRPSPALRIPGPSPKGRGQGEGVEVHSPKLASEESLSTPSEVLQRLIEGFGRENVFVELQRHRLRGEERMVQSLIALAAKDRLPLLATNGVQHALAEGRQVTDVFTCIRHHTHLDQAGRLLAQNSERYLKPAALMAELFRDLPEAVVNTERLAERLEFSLRDLGYAFPQYPTPEGETMDGVLRQQTLSGARNRYENKVPLKVGRQIDQELALIARLGFAGYFLIVADIIRFCRENDIMAQGRGSAANSSVCYCLGITAVDPIKFHTLFERFLSENRKGWPDIDIDLPSGDRRERVIQEVYRRYGRHGAAMTANVITYRGRSAAREIGKALNLPGDILDRYSGLFANGDFPHTLQLQKQMEMAGLRPEHPRAAAFISLYQQIHGLPRHLGQHSGGMVICQGQLSSVVPLEPASMPGRSVLQWDKDDCENLGIIKVDLLGLGMMSVLQDAITLTQERGRPVDLAKIPQDDPLTYEMMQKADTIGVFQIESRAQMATLPRMKPKCFYDVVIEVAIIRPGPIQGHLTHPYLRRRNGIEPVTYYAPQLKPVLERTLGVPLFQEQMLEMAKVMARLSGDEAEELRRAMSFHRSDERMQRAKTRLRTAMDRASVPPDVAERITEAVGSFALYGFPESHAISFGLLAYGSAYLKVHRPLEFYASLLNNQPMGFYSSATLVKDAQRHGVRMKPVCVLHSNWECTIEAETKTSDEPLAPPVVPAKDQTSSVRTMRTSSSSGRGSAPHCPDLLRLGFCVVSGIHRERVQQLVEERCRRPFASLEDLRRRVSLTRDELRTLAEIGALNALSAHRREALWRIEQRIEEDLFSFHPQRSSSARQIPANLETKTPSPLKPMSDVERTRADYSGTKLTLGPHPMALIRPHLPDVWRACDLPQARHGLIIRVAGNVICRQRPGTAKGFVFVSLEDETGITNAIVEPELFERLRMVITQEPFLIITGLVQNVQKVIHIRARQIEALVEHRLVGTESHDFH